MLLYMKRVIHRQIALPPKRRHPGFKGFFGGHYKNNSAASRFGLSILHDLILGKLKSAKTLGRKTAEEPPHRDKPILLSHHSTRANRKNTLRLHDRFILRQFIGIAL